MNGIENAETVIVRIYELRDPRDTKQCPKYIGITIRDLESRLQNHLIKSSLKYKTIKNGWIKGLLNENIKPTIHLIEEVVGWKYACEVEKYWIKEFKDQGYTLKNGTNGGEGTTGRVLSEETKNKIRNGNIGVKRSVETRLNMSRAFKGRITSEETKKKLSKPLSQPLLVIDNGVITIFSSRREFMKKYKVSYSVLCKLLNNEVTTKLNIKIQNYEKSYIDV